MIVDSEKYSVVTRVVGYAISQVRLAASGNAALEHTEKCIRTENGKIVFGLAVRRQTPMIEKLGVWRDILSWPALVSSLVPMVLMISTSIFFAWRSFKINDGLSGPCLDWFQAFKRLTLERECVQRSAFRLAHGLNQVNRQLNALPCSIPQNGSESDVMIQSWQE